METRDRALTVFPTDADAFKYAQENRACVYDAETMQCVYCNRSDH